MIKAEVVIRAADSFGKYVICLVALAVAIPMRQVWFQDLKRRLTIVQIGRLGVNRPLNDGEFDFVELFTFNANSLR